MNKLLFDFSPIIYSAIPVFVSKNPDEELTEGLIRHLLLNTLRERIKEYKDTHEIIICMDSGDYYKKDIFPYYKFKRKQQREDSMINWNAIFPHILKIKEELKEVFLHKIIEIPKLEADDIIATLVKHFRSEEILIISNDTDFMQLQRWGNVKQYSPLKGIYIKSENPELELKEKIIRGDAGDGVPSILSSDDCFALKIRQKPITKKLFEEFINADLDNYEDELIRKRWLRNKSLIDLSEIPQEYEEMVIAAYYNTNTYKKNVLMDYCFKNGLTNILQHMSDF